MGAPAAPPDPAILDYGNPAPRQREFIQAWIETGSSHKAAIKLGADQGIIVREKNKVQKRAELAGWSPMMDGTAHVPSTEQVKARSILTKDSDGNTIWLKTEPRKAEQEELDKLRDELMKGVKPFKRVKAPKKSDSDLNTVYTITDYHLASKAWSLETGADWDIKIAEQTLMQAFCDMMDRSPNSEQCTFAQLGDFLHYDGLMPLTPTAKNVLDADTRYPQLVRVAIRSCIRIVEMLLSKHKNVHVLTCEGNHDLAGSVWLQAVMMGAFRNNPRVTVDQSVFPYYSQAWGKTWNGWHHGHLTKLDKLASKFFSEPQFRAEMGGAEYLYIHTGHHHTKEVREHSGVVIERHSTLNARDAHGARGFDKTLRGAPAITYSREYGEVVRATVVP